MGTGLFDNPVTVTQRRAGRGAPAVASGTAMVRKARRGSRDGVGRNRPAGRLIGLSRAIVTRMRRTPRRETPRAVDQVGRMATQPVVGHREMCDVRSAWSSPQGHGADA